VHQLFEEIAHERALQVELVREVREQLHLAHAAGISHWTTPELWRTS
jgi:hypothetical protein